jgi:hypothetical protein
MRDGKIATTKTEGKQLEMQYKCLKVLHINSYYETRENHERS